MQMTATKVQIRWLLKLDMPRVMEIESLCFEQPWGEDAMLECLKQKNICGMVAEAHQVILGYFVYALHHNDIAILRIAVIPSHQRRGIGKQILERIDEKISAGRRESASIIVPDTEDGVHEFLKECGYLATHVLRDEPRDEYFFMKKPCRPEHLEML